MQINKIVFLLVLMSFGLINGAKQINNFDEVIIDRKTELEYNFTEPALQGDKDVYFFFRFSEPDLQLTVIDGDNNPSDIKIESDQYFYLYKVENIKAQKFTFIIKYPYYLSSLSSTEPLSFLFIDNSKEINFDLNKFSNLKINTHDIQDKPPFPLIFKVDSLKIDKAILTFFEYSYDTSDVYHIYDGDTVIEYCEINNDECKYKNISDKLILEKEKQYKIKFNCFKMYKYDTFNFQDFDVRSIIKEVGLGYNEFALDLEFNVIIFDARNIEESFLYVKQSNDYFGALFITEEEKQDIEDNIDNMEKFFDKYLYWESNEIKHINKYQNKDYLLLVGLEGDDYYGKSFVYFFNSYIKLQNEEIFEMEKGTYGLFIKKREYYEDYDQKYAIISSNKTMGILNTNFNIQELTNILFLDNYEDYYDRNRIILIYADSFKEKTKYKFTSSMFNNMNNVRLINESNLTNYFNTFGPDSLFMRTTFSHIDYNFYTLFFFGLEEKYYFYIKKFFGNIDFYKYKKELDIFSDVEGSYNEYELVNSKLLIVSGFQIYSFYNSYGSFYDLYFQKVNDEEHIQINELSFPLGNLVKLLKENTTYYLDFNVDHLIKLDKDFLDSNVIFTVKNGTKFYLNKTNKFIKDLKGEGITVQTNNKTLLYFYKKIDEQQKIEIIEFDETQKGKTMKFNIANIEKESVDILIAKDFSYEGYYPMLSLQTWIDIHSEGDNSIIYIENLYDNLKAKLDEEEKYYIYIY